MKTYFCRIFLLPALLFFVLSSCGKKDASARLAELKAEREKIDQEIADLEKAGVASKDSSNIKRKNVSVTKVQPENFEHYIEMQGKVESDKNITLSAKMPGTITSILVKDGQNVSPGHVLAQLDDQQILLGIEELKTNLNMATTVFEKQKNLWDKKIGTEIQYLQAKNNKETLERKLSTLKEQLDNTRIKSPIAGVVDEVSIKIGQTVSPGVPCVRVVNLTDLKAKAEVSEVYSNKVKEGNEVTIFFPGLNKEVRSKVTYVSKVINPLNRTFNVEVNLESDPDYRPNMMSILKVADYKVENAIVIPVNLIMNSESGSYVYVATLKGGGSVAERRHVKQGRSYGGKVEILDGLKAGDQLITTGYQELNEGEELVVSK